MALSQSALSELLEAFRAGEGVNLIRDAVRLALQELIEAGGHRGDRRRPVRAHESRRTERNGSRPRVLTTTAGDVQLRIPKLRKGTFFPASWTRAGGSTRPCTRWSWRPTCTACPPGPSMTWSRRWAANRDLQVARCRGSAPAWTRRSAAFRSPHAGAHRGSRTCSSTRPTCTCARRAAGRWSSQAVVVATGVTERRRPGDPRPGRRRQRGRDVLARVPDRTEGPRPVRGAPGHLRPARRPGQGPDPLLRRGGAPTLPGPLRPQPARPGPQVAQGHGRRGVPHDLRPARRRGRRRHLGRTSATSSPPRSRRSVR